MLVDALEAGVETFDATQRELAMRSYGPSPSWWNLRQGPSSSSGSGIQASQSLSRLPTEVVAASRDYGGLLHEDYDDEAQAGLRDDEVPALIKLARQLSLPPSIKSGKKSKDRATINQG